MKLQFSLWLILTVCCSWGQTATLKLDNNYTSEHPNDWAGFELNINGITYKPSDSTHREIKIRKRGLDICYAVINSDTLHFLAKFRKDETYVLRAGCCCAVFTLAPENNERRGTVTYKNKTAVNKYFSVAEHNSDTISAGEQRTFYASESAMCMFKPCSILIAKPEYLDSKYDATFGSEEYDSVKKGQQTEILGLIWFQFLHGEKVIIEYDGKSKRTTIKVDGILSEEEYAKAVSSN